jgi:hypothetical protein
VARAGFFDDNRNRAYPFLTGTCNKPISGPITLMNLMNDVIVDCGFTFGPTIHYDASSHIVYLSKLRRVSNSLYFEFATTCPDLSGVVLTFTRNINDDEYQTEFTDSGTEGLSLSYSTSGSLAATCYQPGWFGYMVSGPLAAIATILPSSGTVTGTVADCIVEPALIRSMYKAAVTSINLANDDRTRYSSPDGCAAVSWPYPVDIIFVNSRCLLGNVLLQSGYNTNLKQNDRDNAIVFNANVGAGDGQPCGEIPLFSGETGSPDSGLLSGGTACGETIQTINGVSRSNFTIQAGTGVQIESVPDENKLVIDINLAGTAVVIPESLMPA